MNNVSTRQYAGVDTMFNNAITSISVGVEDYQCNNNSRNLSAIRNIYSGILLLYKEKLRRLSPVDSDEVLIKSKISMKLDQNGKLTFIGEGKNTVDVNEIENRFKSLEINTDWERLRKIQRLRNNLEHYKFDGDTKILAEVINNCFIIIRNFIIEELDTDPLLVFDNDIWKVFLENEEVFEQERNIVNSSHENSKLKPEMKYFFDSINCMYCGSELVEITEESDINNVNGYCRSCGNDNSGPNLLEGAIDISTKFENYRSVKHGGDPLFDVCPECGYRTFSNEEGICYVCQYEIEYTSCERCRESLSLEEQWFGGLCSYCNYMLEKMMNDD